MGALLLGCFGTLPPVRNDKTFLDLCVPITHPIDYKNSVTVYFRILKTERTLSYFRPLLVYMFVYAIGSCYIAQTYLVLMTFMHFSLGVLGL